MNYLWLLKLYNFTKTKYVGLMIDLWNILGVLVDGEINMKYKQIHK